MKVVDLSSDVAGRFAAKLFAMAGEDVIRPHQAGTVPRMDGWLSCYLDHGKSVAEIVEPRELEAITAEADLVFSSWDSGAYQGLAARRPAVPPHCSEVTTSTFGSTGPYAAWRGGPMADWAAGGYLGITGAPDRPPLIGPEQLCAYVCGYTAAAAAEAAMRSAGRNGTGVKADVSVMETMLSLHQSTFSRLAAGWVRARTGRYAEVYPLTVRPCRDGYVSLGVVTDEEFDRLAITFGLPELLADERFGSRQARMANCDALDKELERYLLLHDADSIVAALQASAVAAAKVVSPLGVLANPQLTQRRFWSRPRGAGGPVMPGNPLRRARTFAADPRPRAILEPPQFGLPSHRDATLPLAGMTVLDFTAYWAGPSATRALADFGAQVIWIERPRSRLDADPATGDPNDVQQYLYHQKMNRHKRSVALDLTTPAGRKAAQRLVASADVLVENFRPGVAIELGLDPALLCAANPQLVYISLSGFGSTGPWGAWRSFGPNLEAASAMLARTGYVGGEPMRLGHALPDGVGGIAGALAALRGLRERDATGRGGWFDISQLEVYTAISGEDIAEASVEGWDFPRIGNRSRTQGVIQGVFRCHGEDQWLALRLGGAEDVRRFSEAAGVLSLDLAGDAPVAEALIERYTATRDKWQLANALQSAGIEAFPVLLSNEFVHDPHLAERGFFVEVSSAGRHHIVPGTPFHSLPPLTDLAGVAPRFGEHTGQVLSALSAVS